MVNVTVVIDCDCNRACDLCPWAHVRVCVTTCVDVRSRGAHANLYACKRVCLRACVRLYTHVRHARVMAQGAIACQGPHVCVYVYLCMRMSVSLCADVCTRLSVSVCACLSLLVSLSLFGCGLSLLAGLLQTKSASIAAARSHTVQDSSSARGRTPRQSQFCSLPEARRAGTPGCTPKNWMHRRAGIW